MLYKTTPVSKYCSTSTTTLCVGHLTRNLMKGSQLKDGDLHKLSERCQYYYTFNERIYHYTPYF